MVIGADQQRHQICVPGDIDAESLACDPTIEAFDHGIGLWCVGFGRAARDFEFRSGSFEVVSVEAGSAIRQDYGQWPPGKLSP
jgi:hypothetical protein